MRRLHHSLAAFRDDIVLAEVLDDARAGVLRPVPAPTVRWWLRDDLDQVSSQYLVWHLIHRGALWASGAAQAAQFVRIILLWRGVCSVRVAHGVFVS